MGGTSNGNNSICSNGGHFFENDNPSIKFYTNGFIRAISEALDVLMSRFSEVDKISKSLLVWQLYIYPPFHELVVEELEGRCRYKYRVRDKRTRRGTGTIATNDKKHE